MKTQAAAWLHAMFNSRELYHEYDPVKAREYYLRTRELKGREPGGDDPESVARANKAAAEAEARQDDVEVQREKLQELLNVALEQLEVRLEQLKAAVKQQKAAAMRRAGVSEETLSRMITQEVKTPGSTKGGTEVADGKAGKTGGAEAGSDAESDSSDSKPKTAAQKKDAAKAAKEKYEEEKAKNPNPDEQLEELQSKVDDANNRIAKVAERIEAMKRIGVKA